MWQKDAGHMEQIDFTTFDSVTALQHLIDAAEHEIAKRQKQALEAARERLRHEAESYGMTLDAWLESMGKKPGRPPKIKGAGKKRMRVEQTPHIAEAEDTG